jgi:transposase-like protein
MQCPRCNSTKVLTEGLDNGKVRTTCQECGHSEIKDKEGRPMLTDDMPAPDRRDLLTEG